LCYSEFASLVPMAGSAYTYGYATLGELFAWIIGWDLILEYALGAVTVSIGWSGYVVSFLRDIGIHMPAELSAARGTLVTLADGTQITAIFNLPAVIIIAIVTLLLVIGIRGSDRHRSIPATRRARSDCRGRRPCRRRLDGLANQIGRDSWSQLGYSRDAAGSVPNFLDHGLRRFATKVCEQGSSKISDTMDHEDSDRN